MSMKLLSNKNSKNFFIILISCLSLAFLIINSNKTQIITQKIKKNLLPRILTQNDDSTKKTTKICEKTSSKFTNYYKTGDKSILGIIEDNTESYDSNHVQALINIVKHYYKKKESKKTSSRILEESQTEYMKNILKYAYHILPLIIIFGIGILSLPGWAVCCCCVCCKCKCCVCKVPKCKTPSIVLGLIFYVIVALISFYALAEQNKLFSGLADIECSVLKFTDEVLDGENSPYPPYWAGIDKIKDTLEQMEVKISDLKNGNTVSNLQVLYDEIYTNANAKKVLFENALKDGGDKITPNYKCNLDSKDYQLDIAELFGTYDNSNNEASPEKSVCNFWLNEYKKTAEDAKTEMTNTITQFTTIFSSSDINGDIVSQSLSSAITKIEEIKTEFMSLKDLIADKIIEKADEIDKTGQLIYTLFFSLLIVFCASVIVFMLLLCCCSGKLCTNLSCCQCFCKFFLHFFWNLMGLIMFILFMGGSLFTISGALGDDMVNVVSYLISDDNLGVDKNTIILGNLKQYLNKCFNDNGDILAELGFDSTIVESFESLKESQLRIEELRNQFIDKWNKFVYTEYKDELDQRVNYNSEDLSLIELGGAEPLSKISFLDLLKEVNEYADDHGENENWDITSSSDDSCDAANPNEPPHSEKIIYHPKNCFPTVKSWVNTELNGASTKLDKIRDFIDKANEADDNTIDYGIRKIITDLNNQYQAFLDTEIDNLEEFKNKIKVITDLTKDYTSDNDKLFSFMNCNFAKSNVEVILYYLKNSFQNDVYEVGIYLLIAAFSMPFAISFTILLIMISNEEIETNKAKAVEAERRKSLKRASLAPPPIIEINAQQNEGNNTEQRPLNNNGGTGIKV